jgi:kumamolisin
VNESRVEIPGSTPHAAGEMLGPADPRRQITITVVLRRALSAPDFSHELLSGQFKPVSPEKAAAITAADPTDVSAVTSFLQRYGLRITDQNLAARTLHAQGTVQQIDAAFTVRLMNVKAPNGSEYLSHQGPISIPAGLSGIIVAVLGLDQHRIAEPR